MTTYLAELVIYDPDVPGTRTLYMANAPFCTGAGDTPAHTAFTQRIIQPLNISRSVFSGGTTQGRSRMGFGDFVLANDDGALDGYLDYGFDGREITVRRVPTGAGPYVYPDDYPVIFRGTMDQAVFGPKSVTIKERDRQAEVEVPLQTTVYAGDNALPDGLEGTPDDLKGKEKPVCLGTVYNWSPPCVNTALLIYQVNDGAVSDVPMVYDRAEELTQEADYATEADLLTPANEPSPGCYKVYPAGGYFRLGSSPAGQVTCDIVEGTTAADRTPAQLYKRCLERKGYTSADWSASDLTTLDTAAGYVSGVMVEGSTTYAAMFDQIAGSVWGWWGIDRTGVFRIKQLLAPTGTPVASFTANKLVDGNPPQKIQTNDPGRGLPSYRTVVQYKRNYTIQRAYVLDGATGPTGVQGPTGVVGPSGAVGATWIGAWDAATAYAVNDVVEYNGSTYICVTANTGQIP